MLLPHLTVYVCVVAQGFRILERCLHSCCDVLRNQLENFVSTLCIHLDGYLWKYHGVLQPINVATSALYVCCLYVCMYMHV